MHYYSIYLCYGYGTVAEHMSLEDAHESKSEREGDSPGCQLFIAECECSSCVISRRLDRVMAEIEAIKPNSDRFGQFRPSGVSFSRN